MLSEQRLPLVTLILTNWNYDEFVGRMIDSIRVQTYPHIEVVVVDNASTDGSRDVIASHVAGDSRFRVVHSLENDGPMGAALRGLSMTSGSLVCFLDADDYLLTDYVSTHVQVHLALPVAVAVTSVNVIEVSKDGTVLCGSRRPFAMERLAEMRGLRHIESVTRVKTISDEAYGKLSPRVCRIRPRERGWHWSPGTANCYRRLIVEMTKPRTSEAARNLAPDGHFTRACHWIAGSALIDQPLSAYRLHGRNFYVAAPSLTGFRNPAGGPARKHVPNRRRELLRVILDQVAAISGQLGEERFWGILDQATDVMSEPLDTELNNDDVRSMFAVNLRPMMDRFGSRATLRELRSRMSRPHLHTIVRQAYQGKIPAPIVRTLIVVEYKWLISLRQFKRRRRPKKK